MTDNEIFYDAFSIKFARIEIKNWEYKKKQILERIGELTNEGDPIASKEKEYKEYLETNFFMHLDDKDRMDVSNILKEELYDFSEESGCDVQVDGSWIERTHSGMNHNVHNHGALGYSAACYVCYDPKVHTPTRFLAPFSHSIDGELIHHDPENVKEGTLILFPSYLPHYTRPNLSTKERIVLSFNLECF